MGKLKKIMMLGVFFLCTSFVGGFTVYADHRSNADVQVDTSLSNYFPDDQLATAIKTKLIELSNPGTLEEQLAQITELDISNRSITNLTGISYLFNLVTLNASNNLIAFIPEEFNALVSLENLDISKNHLTGEMPLSIATKQNLKVLNASDNQLTTIFPTQVASAPFTYFFEDKNLAQAVADSVGKHASDLTNLEELGTITIVNASNKNIVTISGIENIPNLKELNVSYNQLVSIPDSIAELTALQTIDFSHNHITSLNNYLLLLSQLLALNGSYNEMEGTIPANYIFDFPNLSYLNLSHNKFYGTLPEENDRIPLPEYTGTVKKTLAYFCKIEELSVEYNKITDLTDQIGTLSSLRYLNHAFNKVTYINRELLKLENLEQYIANNNVMTGSIPMALLTKPNLYILNVSSNFLSGFS